MQCHQWPVTFARTLIGGMVLHKLSNRSNRFITVDGETEYISIKDATDDDDQSAGGAMEIAPI